MFFSRCSELWDLFSIDSAQPSAQFSAILETSPLSPCGLFFAVSMIRSRVAISASPDSFDKMMLYSRMLCVFTTLLQHHRKGWSEMIGGGAGKFDRAGPRLQQPSAVGPTKVEVSLCPF